MEKTRMLNAQDAHYRAVAERAARIRKRRRSMLRIPMHYLIGSGLVLLFAIVYDQFSHGVHSIYMDGAFLIPAVGGFLTLLLAARDRRVRAGAASARSAAADRRLSLQDDSVAGRRAAPAREAGAESSAPSGRIAFAAGILTLTVGSIVQGIFQIAGTSSAYMLFYPIAGLALTAVGIYLWRSRG